MAKQGGFRQGAGRKSRDHEMKIIEALDKHIDQKDVFIALRNQIKKNNMKAIELYLGYRYGKPRENMALDISDFTASFTEAKASDKK